jgi:hypothetical protein
MRRGDQNAERSTAVEALTYLLALCSSAWSTGSAMTASWKTLPLRQAERARHIFTFPHYLPSVSPSEWVLYQAHVRRGLRGGCTEHSSDPAA